MDHRMGGFQSGTLCTDEDILIELIFIYFPKALWILETQSLLKAPVNMGKPSIP